MEIQTKRKGINKEVDDDDNDSGDTDDPILLCRQKENMKQR